MPAAAFWSRRDDARLRSLYCRKGLDPAVIAATMLRSFQTVEERIATLGLVGPDGEAPTAAEASAAPETRPPREPQPSPRPTVDPLLYLMVCEALTRAMKAATTQLKRNTTLLYKAQRSARQAIAERPLSELETKVLVTLDRTGPIDMGELSNATGFALEAIGKAARLLEQRGYVKFLSPTLDGEKPRIQVKRIPAGHVSATTRKVRVH